MIWIALAMATEPRGFPEIEACMAAGNDTQLAINFCQARSARVEAARMRMAEERLGWMGEAKLLEAAGVSFAAFREARCTYLGKRWEGGSGQPMIVHGCRAGTNRGRAVHLENLLDGTGVAPDLATSDAALNAVWKAEVPKSDEGMLGVQRLWLTYRDAQCDWEETRMAATKSACLARLTEARTTQILQDAHP